MCWGSGVSPQDTTEDKGEEDRVSVQQIGQCSVWNVGCVVTAFFLFQFPGPFPNLT